MFSRRLANHRDVDVGSGSGTAANVKAKEKANMGHSGAVVAVDSDDQAAAAHARNSRMSIASSSGVGSPPSTMGSGVAGDWYSSPGGHGPMSVASSEYSDGELADFRSAGGGHRSLSRRSTGAWSSSSSKQNSLRHERGRHRVSLSQSGILKGDNFHRRTSSQFSSPYFPHAQPRHRSSLHRRGTGSTGGALSRVSTGGLSRISTGGLSRISTGDGLSRVSTGDNYPSRVSTGTGHGRRPLSRISTGDSSHMGGLASMYSPSDRSFPPVQFARDPLGVQHGGDLAFYSDPVPVRARLPSRAHTYEIPEDDEHEAVPSSWHSHSVSQDSRSSVGAPKQVQPPPEEQDSPSQATAEKGWRRKLGLRSLLGLRRSKTSAVPAMARSPPAAPSSGANAPQGGRSRGHGRARSSLLSPKAGRAPIANEELEDVVPIDAWSMEAIKKLTKDETPRSAEDAASRSKQVPPVSDARKNEARSPSTAGTTSQQGEDAARPPALKVPEETTKKPSSRSPFPSWKSFSFVSPRAKQRKAATKQSNKDAKSPRVEAKGAKAGNGACDGGVSVRKRIKATAMSVSKSVSRATTGIYTATSPKSKSPTTHTSPSLARSRTSYSPPSPASSDVSTSSFGGRRPPNLRQVGGTSCPMIETREPKTPLAAVSSQPAVMDDDDVTPRSPPRKPNGASQSAPVPPSPIAAADAANDSMFDRRRTPSPYGQHARPHSFPKKRSFMVRDSDPFDSDDTTASHEPQSDSDSNEEIDVKSRPRPLLRPRLMAQSTDALLDFDSALEQIEERGKASQSDAFDAGDEDKTAVNRAPRRDRIKSLDHKKAIPNLKMLAENRQRALSNKSRASTSNAPLNNKKHNKEIAVRSHNNSRSSSSDKGTDGAAHEAKRSAPAGGKRNAQRRRPPPLLSFGSALEQIEQRGRANRKESERSLSLLSFGSALEQVERREKLKGARKASNSVVSLRSALEHIDANNGNSDSSRSLLSFGAALDRIEKRPTPTAPTINAMANLRANLARVESGSGAEKDDRHRSRAEAAGGGSRSSCDDDAIAARLVDMQFSPRGIRKALASVEAAAAAGGGDEDDKFVATLNALLAMSQEDGSGGDDDDTVPMRRSSPVPSSPVPRRHTSPVKPSRLPLKINVPRDHILSPLIPRADPSGDGVPQKRPLADDRGVVRPKPRLQVFVPENELAESALREEALAPDEELPSIRFTPMHEETLLLQWLHDVSRAPVPPLHECARLFADLCNRIEPFTFRVLPSKTDFGALSDGLKQMMPLRKTGAVVFEPSAVVGHWDEIVRTLCHLDGLARTSPFFHGPYMRRDPEAAAGRPRDLQPSPSLAASSSDDQSLFLGSLPPPVVSHRHRSLMPPIQRQRSVPLPELVGHHAAMPQYSPPRSPVSAHRARVLPSHAAPAPSFSRLPRMKSFNDLPPQPSGVVFPPIVAYPPIVSKKQPPADNGERVAALPPLPRWNFSKPDKQQLKRVRTNPSQRPRLFQGLKKASLSRASTPRRSLIVSHEELPSNSSAVIDNKLVCPPPLKFSHLPKLRRVRTAPNHLVGMQLLHAPSPPLLEEKVQHLIDPFESRTPSPRVVKSRSLSPSLSASLPGGEFDYPPMQVPPQLFDSARPRGLSEGVANPRSRPEDPAPMSGDEEEASSRAPPASASPPVFAEDSSAASSDHEDELKIGPVLSESELEEIETRLRQDSRREGEERRPSGASSVPLPPLRLRNRGSHSSSSSKSIARNLSPPAVSPFMGSNIHASPPSLSPPPPLLASSSKKGGHHSPSPPLRKIDEIQIPARPNYSPPNSQAPLAPPNSNER